MSLAVAYAEPWPPAGPGANAVRAPNPARERRTVQVVYTAFARVEGCRHATLYDPTALEVARELVRRTRLGADQLHPRGQALGDVAILRRMPADAPAEFLPGTVQPVAFVDGLAAEPLAEALARLALAGEPRRELPFFTIAEFVAHASAPVRGAVTSGPAATAGGDAPAELPESDA